MTEQIAAGDLQLISLVVPCCNEAEIFPELRAALVRLAEPLMPRYRVEFVLVDDGSRDSTWEQIVAFAAADPRVRGIALSRNFGHQCALTSGYDFAGGDAVVCMDADLQDPPEAVLRMIEEWEKGADIVYAVRLSREGETAFKRMTASLFYRLLQYMGQTSAPPNSGDFRLMSRRGLVALRQLREKHRYLRGLVGWVGFRTAQIGYHRQPRRAGLTKYTLVRMVGFALDAIISSSALPLRLTYLMAVVAALPFIGYLFYALLMRLLFNIPLVPGWSSLVLAVVAFGSLILFSLGIFGEYLGRIYEQVKDRPLYLVREVTPPQPEALSGTAATGREGDDGRRL